MLVGIDDRSIAAFGEWPWPRSIHAVLLESLARYNPRTVIFDVLFTEASPNPAEDARFESAVKQSGNVILPFFYDSEFPFHGIFPIDRFLNASAGTAYVNAEPEPDGVMRKFRAFVKGNRTRYYHPAVIAMLQGMTDDVSRTNWLRSLPLDAKDHLWINFPGRMDSFAALPVHDVIRSVGGEQAEEMRKTFENRIVLVGQTATGTTDLRTSPFAVAEPGMVILGATFHTLLTGDYLRATPWYLDLALLLFFALLVGFVTEATAPKRGLLLVLFMMVFYAAVNISIFYFARWILPLFLPIVTIFVAYVFTLYAKHLEVRLQGELLNRELKTASRIQENFLPASPPSIDGVDVAFQCKFAKQVGGDLYDWVDLGDGCLGVCVGDVSGKGVPAALYMARAISEFRRERKSEVAPGKVQEALNNSLSRSGAAGMFLTLFYAVINIPKKKISFSSAGHDPIIYFKAREGKAAEVNGAQGTPLGLFEGAPYDSSELSFESGDLFVTISDGIKELRNPKKEEFGMERLRVLVEQEGSAKHTSQRTIKNIFDVTGEFQKDAPVHDDRTVLCVRFK